MADIDEMIKQQMDSTRCTVRFRIKQIEREQRSYRFSRIDSRRIDIGKASYLPFNSSP
jgi:hypothetical protein